MENSTTAKDRTVAVVETRLEVTKDHQAATAPPNVWLPIAGSIRKTMSPKQNFQSERTHNTTNQTAVLRRGRR